MAKYRVVIGLNYPDGKGGEKRAEPGETVNDLPLTSVSWLLEQNCIELIEAAPAAEEQGG